MLFPNLFRRAVERSLYVAPFVALGSPDLVSATKPQDLARGGNMLLARMDPADLQRLSDAARREQFPRGATLIEAYSTARCAYFVEHGVASIVKPADGQRSTEICLIGREGIVGSSIILTNGVSPYRTFVQTDGLVAVTVDGARLAELFDRCSSLRRVLLPAIEAQTIQVAESLVAALWLPVTARLARWLLLYRERLQSDRIEVTHEFLALMVGAQRSKITISLHDLEDRGAIYARRGMIVIRDAAALQRLI